MLSGNVMILSMKTSITLLRADEASKNPMSRTVLQKYGWKGGETGKEDAVSRAAESTGATV